MERDFVSAVRVDELAVVWTILATFYCVCARKLGMSGLTEDQLA